MGRKRNNASYEEWETDEKLDMIEDWSAKGLILDEIAHNMGISRSTLYQWRKASTLISSALKRGEDAIIDRVEHALIDSAIADRNITAMIFFLKNKRPDAWKDKRDTEISGSGSLSFAWTGGKEAAKDNG